MSRVSVLGCAVAVSAAIAGSAVAQTPANTTATAPVAPVTPPAAGFIGPGVSIEGVDVSGLSRRDAELRIASQIVAPKRTPLVLVVRGRRIPIDPAAAGYRYLVPRAVQAALNVGRSQPAGPVDIPLTERVERASLRRVLEWRSRGVRIAARDASVAYTAGGQVRITRARKGVELDIEAALPQVESALLSGARTPLQLPVRRVEAAVPTIPTTVFVDRDRFRLTVVRAAGIRTFPIAVGQPAYPTPSGSFHVVDMQRNPTWFPPDSRWAAGLGPVPPGVGNPLGTRWMGLSAPGIGIHGTPASYSIGSRASHGCIRMQIRDAERVFDMLSVGTPVVIV